MGDEFMQNTEQNLLHMSTQNLTEYYHRQMQLVSDCHTPIADIPELSKKRAVVESVFGASLAGRILTSKDNVPRNIPDIDEHGYIEMVKTEQKRSRRSVSIPIVDVEESESEMEF